MSYVYSKRMTRSDKIQFRLYLRQCTDAQVRGVYEKERAAGRRTETELAKDEAALRGIEL